jgi:hypothetical protein
LEAEVHQALRNVAEVLQSHGARMRDVVKTTIYLADVDDFDRMNRAYLEHWDPRRLPARTTAGVSLPFNALVEIEAWARLGATSRWRRRLRTAARRVARGRAGSPPEPAAPQQTTAAGTESI